MKILYIFFWAYSCAMFSLNNQKSEALSDRKINLVASFDEKLYEFVSFAGKTEIMFYGKDPFSYRFDEDKRKLVLTDNPLLFQTHASLLPHPLQNSVKSIEYIAPLKKEAELNGVLSINTYTYGYKEWYKVKVLFSNDEERFFLLPADVKISLYDPTLSATIQIDVSCLKQPLILEEIKCVSNKK